MKLIQRTYRIAIIGLLPVFILGGVYSYLMIRHVIYEETDEFLTFEMNRLKDYHHKFAALPDLHMVTELQEGVTYTEPVFRDTLILEPGDNELVPYRQLFFTLDHKGQDFTIVLRHLLVGNDDILEGTFLILLGLMAIISLAMFLLVDFVSRDIWKPFYRTLSTLTSFRIHRDKPDFPPTGIREFDSLNATVEKLLQKISDDFHRTKEFNENASHELQTQLAIIRASAEELINDEDGRYNGNVHLQAVYNAVVKLSRMERSLMLLSRIGNLEFDDRVDLDLQKVVEQGLEPFLDVIRLRQIRLTTHLAECPVRMDPGLADILVNNLLKNAVKHNVEKGHMDIRLEPDRLTVANSGLPHEGPTDKLVQRFAKGPLGNAGIGLAIVQQICDLYGFGMDYKVSKENEHVITIFFHAGRESQISPK
ncbi:MAG: HAMP domain-containing histidine kinase [Saprospiraceae bacterium]|nr:HAMP domain-containing histidine kinase [Saprospiraceae bacterium]